MTQVDSTRLETRADSTQLHELAGRQVGRASDCLFTLVYSASGVGSWDRCGGTSEYTMRSVSEHVSERPLAAASWIRLSVEADTLCKKWYSVLLTG